VIGESDADVAERVGRVAHQAGGQGQRGRRRRHAGPWPPPPNPQAATPEQVVEKLKRMRELGCEYAILYFPEGRLRPVRLSSCSSER